MLHRIKKNTHHIKTFKHTVLHTVFANDGLIKLLSCLENCSFWTNQQSHDIAMVSWYMACSVKGKSVCMGLWCFSAVALTFANPQGLIEEDIEIISASSKHCSDWLLCFPVLLASPFLVNSPWREWPQTLVVLPAPHCQTQTVGHSSTHTWQAAALGPCHTHLMDKEILSSRPVGPL